MTAADPTRVLDAVWRIEAARIVGALARLTGDVGAAEELADDTMVIALQQWRVDGVPAQPGPWLMATAKHRAIDYIRRRVNYHEKVAQLGRDLQIAPALDEDSVIAALDDHIGDDVLRLMFIACHPILPAPARTALALRLLGGLRTDEIARAFLVPEPTIAQRISRAKRTIAEKKLPFEVPAPAELPSRLGAVLEAIYLIFNEGYSATAGDDWARPNLCQEALRLGRILAGLMPAEPEVHGLAALMELQAARLPARIDAAGAAVMLGDQDRTRWDRLLLRRGLAALQRARDIGGVLGPYVVQAEIAACHVRPETDWSRIAALYQVLAYLWPSPVVELNRAVAIGRASGAEPGLAITDALAAHGKLAGYPQLPAVRADLLTRLGRIDQARAEYDRAIGLTRNAAEAALFRRQRDALPGGDARSAEG